MWLPCKFGDLTKDRLQRLCAAVEEPVDITVGRLRITAASPDHDFFIKPRFERFILSHRGACRIVLGQFRSCSLNVGVQIVEQFFHAFQSRIRSDCHYLPRSVNTAAF